MVSVEYPRVFVTTIPRSLAARVDMVHPDAEIGHDLQIGCALKHFPIDGVGYQGNRSVHAGKPLHQLRLGKHSIVGVFLNVNFSRSRLTVSSKRGRVMKILPSTTLRLWIDHEGYCNVPV